MAGELMMLYIPNDELTSALNIYPCDHREELQFIHSRGFDNLREARRIQHSRARARKHGQDDSITMKDWYTAIKHFKGRCAYCGMLLRKKEKWRNHPAFTTVDHYIPIVRGGGTTVTNCLPCCQQCNNSKEGKNPEKWLEWRFGFQAIGVYLRILEYFALVGDLR